MDVVQTSQTSHMVKYLRKIGKSSLLDIREVDDAGSLTINRSRLSGSTLKDTRIVLEV